MELSLLLLDKESSVDVPTPEIFRFFSERRELQLVIELVRED